MNWTKLSAILYLYVYMPIFHPRLWWAHQKACAELLESIGWIDIDIE